MSTGAKLAWDLLPNPRQLDNGKWVWYDEAYSDSKEYDTQKEATQALFEYAAWLNGEMDRQDQAIRNGM